MLQRCACVLVLALTALAVRADELSTQARVAASARGAALFGKYCVLCHGRTAEGNGAAAKVYTPPPANLTRSRLSDADKRAIISRGGGAVGRSPNMPPWGQELTATQIGDVIVYLRTLLVAR